MMQSLASPGLNLSPTSILILISITTIIFILLRKHHQAQALSRLHNCAPAPNENDRFRYDFLGLFKALELAYHFRQKTSLPYTNALFLRYGETYTSHVLTFRLTFTCNAENTKRILSTAFSDFDSSPLRKPLFEPITPHGIFTLDGAGWKKSREQLRTRLANLRKIIDLKLCEQHFQAFLKHVPPAGQLFDIQACAFALSLDMQTRFSLGESVDALSFTQSPEKNQFLDDLLFVKERIVQDGFRGPLRHLFSKRRFLQSCRRARQYVIDHVTRDMERRSSGKEKHTDEEIAQSADQALSILLANDSMSTTLSGLFYCLAQDKRVVKKLRASIIDTIGLDPPTWSQLGSLHYVRWVLQEAMRLYPPVVLNARIANKPTTLPTGGGPSLTSPILIQKNEIIVFSTWARHRLGTDFGPLPETFSPERWQSLSADMIGFIPFNKGPRVCPGQHYATIVLTYLVTRMFQTFEKVEDYNVLPWEERISMTFENGNGVLVGLS
ncbi:putative cytochrome P450 oxidoreductase/alkane hydroxylase [Aspergillus ellipticus CBS 707.79]|uniref:Putative cytochrome P450 oxidoreductase/alkane hydroxylase n=1 Tax=Aspergillus ellipticus CBS 707.79 TaxID=1448320 RepID=A0A319DQW1_9EURO|nr:putative cytochrome P450 oxidoreductase/alkane hydroxylase [Aspergillus ellipticus CBS 707.79]